MTARLRAKVLRVLLSGAAWVDRAAFNALTSCQPALDDVLADLVIEGHVEFRKFAGYRLRGGACVRDARVKLMNDPLLLRAVSVVVVDADGGQRLVMGVAERRTGLAQLGGGVVTYELALPVCGAPAQLQAQMQSLANFFKTGLLLGLKGMCHE